METIKLRIKIAKIRPKVFGNGRLGAVISVVPVGNKSAKIFEKHGLTEILVDSLNDILDNSLSLGTEHIVLLNVKTTALEFKSRIAPVVDAEPFIDSLVVCPNCGTELKIVPYGEKQCQNEICSARSTSPVIKILIQELPEFSKSEVQEFLDNYLVDGAPVSISNLFEFKELFFLLKDKNTASREDQWKTAFPEKGERFYQIEVAYQDVLGAPRFPVRAFWAACNFPEMPYGSHPDWDKISPEDIFTDEGNARIEADQINSKIIKVISDNLDFVALMLSVYTRDREVLWIKP